MTINTMRRFEELEYREFKRWFDNKPLKHPNIAITASLVRNIARLVYEREEEIMKIIDRGDWFEFDEDWNISQLSTRERLKEELKRK